MTQSIPHGRSIIKGRRNHHELAKVYGAPPKKRRSLCATDRDEERPIPIAASRSVF
jgi:hypothetical protein